MAVNSVAQVAVIGRGGFPSIGPKVGLIQNTVDLAALTAGNDSTAVFTLPAGTLVIGMGIEVVVATAEAVTVSLGFDGTAAGSRTEFAGELATNGAVGTKLAGGYAKANVVLTAADSIVAEISGDAGAAGQIRVWALIADVADMDG